MADPAEWVGPGVHWFGYHVVCTVCTGVPQHWRCHGYHQWLDCSKYKGCSGKQISPSPLPWYQLSWQHWFDTQEKTVVDIAVELDRLMQLGQAGQLGMADLTGGTFSLSNIGAVSGCMVKRAQRMRRHCTRTCTFLYRATLRHYWQYVACIVQGECGAGGKCCLLQ